LGAINRGEIRHGHADCDKAQPPLRSSRLNNNKRKRAPVKTIAEKLKKKEKPVRQFLLYSLRYTFLIRLGESGGDVWTLARIAGHSSIAMLSRYVHPGNDAVMDAILRMVGGHKSGHSGTHDTSDGSTRWLLNG
jgi:integrase